MLRVVLISVLALVLFAEADKYTTKYDNVDIDEILTNDRLLSGYTNCLLKEGKEAKCSPDGTELKKIIPDALKNGCESCNEKQKDATKKIINYLIENKADVWKELEAKFDSTGQYKKIYKEKIRGNDKL